jgi:BRO family, N-terminal domain.
MNNSIIQTNPLFGEVRFMGIEGKPYALANDVLRTLGYKKGNWSTTLSRKCNPKGVAKCSILTNGGSQMQHP